MTEARNGAALGVQAGIHTLPVPTPFAVGRVNCYLIEDEPLTLVDTGPNSGTSLDELERALSAIGRRIEDIELLVLTHQHMDHLGLMNIVVRRSGAEVAALAGLRPYLADFGRSSAADDAFSRAVMRRHGVPPDLATVLTAVGAAFRAFGSSGAVTQPLRDGDRLVLRDRTLHVQHRPGHSPSDTVFWDAERALALGGDHLLARISSNPLITRPLDDPVPAGAGPASANPPDPSNRAPADPAGPSADPAAPAHRAPADPADPASADPADAAGPPSADPAGPGVRPSALIAYIASLQRTRELPCELVLPGHGPPIVDHVALVDERLRQHERRAAKILAILRERPLSAYDVALRIWGNVALTQAYLTLSEVLGHLDLLLERGQVVERDDGERSVFAPS